MIARVGLVQFMTGCNKIKESLSTDWACEMNFSETISTFRIQSLIQGPQLSLHKLPPM